MKEFEAGGRRRVVHAARHLPSPDHTTITVVHPDGARVRRLQQGLLKWGAVNQRSFFWREPHTPAFHVLVTEMLLAKTRATTVDPVIRVLLTRFPTVVALAAARPSTVARILRPLGLQRKRAAALVACAKAVLTRYDGQVPQDMCELMSLPSIGRYAASAIATVAFEAHAAVVDANVLRIYQRVFSLPARRAHHLDVAESLWAFAKSLLPHRAAKAFNWALLDLGGMVCTPKNPSCERCPIAQVCDLNLTRAHADSGAPDVSAQRHRLSRRRSSRLRLACP